MHQPQYKMNVSISVAIIILIGMVSSAANSTYGSGSTHYQFEMDASGDNTLDYLFTRSIDGSVFEDTSTNNQKDKVFSNSEKIDNNNVLKGTDHTKKRNGTSSKNLVPNPPDSESRGSAVDLDGNQPAFITKWNSTFTSSGSSGPNKVKLPLKSTGTYNFDVDWGDGSENDTITTWDQTETTHTYNSEGIYTIVITGTITGWQFRGTGDRLKILEILQWGNLNLGQDGSYAFQGSSNLIITASDTLNLNGTNTLAYAFQDCESLGTSGNLNSWDVSNVISMEGMFYRATSFNNTIGDWNVSKVTNMKNMFNHASSFNQNIEDWDVSSVNHMGSMFSRANIFNKNIGLWNISNVIDIGSMFSGASSFNSPLNNWDVSNVENMYGVFAFASSFNQPLTNWDVSNVTNMRNMFNGATSFDQPLGSWNVTNVGDMSLMFSGVTLSTTNYDDLLIAWSHLTLQNDVTFDAGNSKYGSQGSTARIQIIDQFSWTIIDGGLASGPSPPQNLDAIPGDSFVELFWTSPLNIGDSPINWYNVYRSTSGRNYILIGNSSHLSYNDTTVINDNTYYFVVTAVNNIGESHISSEVQVTPRAVSSTSNSSSLNNRDSTRGFLNVDKLTLFSTFFVLLIFTRKNGKKIY